MLLAQLNQAKHEPGFVACLMSDLNTVHSEFLSLKKLVLVGNVAQSSMSSWKDDQRI